MIYLDNSATTHPKPESVFRAVYECMVSSCGNPGRSGHSLSRAAEEIVYNTRCAVADMMGGEPERVVFTRNATEALSLVIKSLAREGSGVLISEIEHNSVYRPLYALSKKGVRTDFFKSCKSASDTVARFSAALRDDISLAVVNHRSNIASFENPIYEIGEVCKKRGIPLVIDASQSVGICKLDIEKTGAAAICAPGHKSLYGLQGSGFALISKAIDDERIIPLYEGGSGGASRDPYMPRSLPERAEAGTLSVPSIAGLLAGVRFVKERGEDELLSYESGLIERLKYLLEQMRGIEWLSPSNTKGNVLSFSVRGVESAKLAELLDARGICTRAGLHCAPLAHKCFSSPEKGTVRVSVGAFNKISDIEFFVKCLIDIMREECAYPVFSYRR